MPLDKIIKKDAVLLSITIISLVLIIIGTSYAYFMSVDKGKNNIISVGDLKVSFCIDQTCKNNYANFGQVIGTKNVNGKSVIDNIYPYNSDEEALKSYPYIFNINNTGSLRTYVTIRLKEDKDYVVSKNYEGYSNITNLYSNHIKVAVSECNNSINIDNANIYNYSQLDDNIIVKDDIFDSGVDKTYCLWTYLDNSSPNEVQNTYFVANLDFKAEYKPYSE